MPSPQLAQRLEPVRRTGHFPSEALETFATYLEGAPDEALFRMNPYRFAEATGLPPRQAVDLFLHATHAGILEFSWGVICPACGWFLTTPSALRSLTEKRCQMCEVQIPARLDDNVEVAFTVAPSVRRIRFHDPPSGRFSEDTLRATYSPSIEIPKPMKAMLSESMLWDGSVPRDSERTVELKLEPGRYAVVSPAQHIVARIEIDPAAEAHEAAIDIFAGQFVPDRLRVGPGTLRLRLHNRQANFDSGVAIAHDLTRGEHSREVLLGLAAQRTLHRFFTGKELVTSQAFQELFRAQSLPSDLGLELKSVTLLFTDLKVSTELYQRVGDFTAYGLVREHFAALRDEVAARGGGVVKTIGDAIMASFPEPLPALEAAAAMHRRSGQVNDALALTIGLHAGPCIAVELNERLDYFGQTVNVAARVQGLAGAQEIVTTDAVLAAPGTKELLAKEGLSSRGENASLKGIDGLFPVHRVTGAQAARKAG